MDKPLSQEERDVIAKSKDAGCPACGEQSGTRAIERYGKYDLFACAGCGLQFWTPREMPEASWYERMYDNRDQSAMPLEPGHNYFLSDVLAPSRGKLLDIGCGTGNFLAAAQRAGYQVSGTELDRTAAQFARERMGITRVLPFTISRFVEQIAGEKFDVVTFFEVLEHQSEPLEFLRNVKSCLQPGGTIALSVPNRERWLTGPDVLDYPPNHFLRWSPSALAKFLEAEGFELLTMRQQPVGIGHTAQMINMALSTGITQMVLGEKPAGFRDLIQMTTDDAAAAIRAEPSLRLRIMKMLGHIKRVACYPLAVAAFPYVRMRGYKGTYLYCLARLRA